MTAECTCPDGELSIEAAVIIAGHWPDCPRGIEIQNRITAIIDTPRCSCGCGRPVWKWRLAEQCAYALAGMCAGKIRFTRQAAADRHCRADRNSYRCEVCGFWHNGSAAAVTGELEAQRRAVLAGLRERGNGAVLTILAGALNGMNRQDWKTGRERDR